MPSKPKIIWIDGVGCNGCSHSFFNASFLDEFEFLYHPLLDSDEFRIQKCDVLVIEGAIRSNFLRLGYDLKELISKLIRSSKRVIAVGNCAVWGGVFGEGILFNKTSKGRFYKCKDKVINIPGCPPHYDWIMYALKMWDKEILLDEFNRPREIFSFTSHMGCSRNEYFEWKIDARELGEREGWRGVCFMILDVKVLLFIVVAIKFFGMR
ncbi:MAG: hypothetical protein ABGX23_06455 [Nautiliaceae bacterium]